MFFYLLTVVGLTLPTIVTWVYFDLLAASAPVLQQTAYAIGKSVQFALPLIGWRYRAASLYEPGQLGQSGKPIQWRLSLLWGLGSGLLIAASMLILYHGWLVPSGAMVGPTVAAREKLSGMGLDSKPLFLVLALFYSLCHSGLEEYYWRWFVFRHLAGRWPLAAAVVVSSLGFMAHHVLVLARYFGWGSPLTYTFSLGVAVGGMVWAILYRRYGTLAGPWLSHALVDAAIFAIAYHMAWPA